VEHIVPAAVFFELQAKKRANKKGLLKSEEIKSRFGKLSSPDSAFSFKMSTSIKGIYEAKNITLACPMDIASECYSYRADDIAQKIVVAALADGELEQQTCSKKVKPKSRQNSGKQLANVSIVPIDEEECETDTETTGPSGFLGRRYSAIAGTASIEVEIT